MLLPPWITIEHICEHHVHHLYWLWFLFDCRNGYCEEVYFFSVVVSFVVRAVVMLNVKPLTVSSYKYGASSCSVASKQPGRVITTPASKKPFWRVGICPIVVPLVPVANHFWMVANHFWAMAHLVNGDKVHCQTSLLFLSYGQSDKALAKHCLPMFTRFGARHRFLANSQKVKVIEDESVFQESLVDVSIPPSNGTSEQGASPNGMDAWAARNKILESYLQVYLQHFVTSFRVRFYPNGLRPHSYKC